MKTHTLTNAMGTEFRKALRCKTLWIALAVGLAFVALDLVERYDAIQKAIDNVEWAREQGYGMYLGYSVFSSWMGIAGGSYGSALFFAVWPVLAAMACGWSYNNERISGVYNQIVVRVGAKRYFLAKHTAAFLSGGIVVALPLLVDLLGLALIYPARGGVTLLDCHFLCGLAAYHPWIYCLARCALCFLFGGAAACMCHVVGTYLRHGVMVVLTPYAVLIAVEALTTVLRESLPTEIIYTISPYRMVMTRGYAEPGWLLLGTLAVLTVGSYAIGYFQVKRHELV